MTSLTENAGKTTFYNIFIIINDEFNDLSKIILKSVAPFIFGTEQIKNSFSEMHGIVVVSIIFP